MGVRNTKIRGIWVIGRGGKEKQNPSIKYLFCFLLLFLFRIGKETNTTQKIDKFYYFK